MKQLLILVALTLYAVVESFGQNIPITEKIIYKVVISDTDNPENTNVYNNIGESQRMFFVNTTMDAVKSGRIKAYEDESFTKELSIDDIANILTIHDTAYVPNPNNPSEEMMVAVEEEISNDEFTAIYFMEQWSFDKNSLRMNKRVVAMAPLLELMVDSENGEGEVVGHKILFWIKL